MKNRCIVIQKELSTCGACSIYSIVLHYKGYVPLEKIIEDTLTDKSGTNAYELVRTLKQYGFNSYGINSTLNELSKDILPVIAHTNKNGYEHFLVIYNFDENKVVTMDPEFGKKLYTRCEFEEIFDNNIIVAKPLGQIIKMERSNTLFKIYKSFFKNNYKTFSLLFMINLLLIILSVIPSFYIKLSKNKDDLIVLSILFIIALFTRFLFILLQHFIQNKLSFKLEKKINKFSLNHIFNLKIKYIQNKRVGEIVQKINDVFSVNNFFIKIIIICFLDVVLILFGSIITLLISKKLYLIFLIGEVLSLLFNISFSKSIYRKNANLLRLHNNYYGNFVEYLEGLESIKNLNKSKYFLKKLYNSFHNYLNEGIKNKSFSHFIANLQNFIGDLNYLLINMYGLYLCYNDLMNIVDLITFNSLISLILNSFDNLFELVPNIIEVKAIFNTVSEFFDVEEEKNIDYKLENFNEIKIVNLSYSYDYYHYTINNLNLNIKSGTKLLIKGASGSGKSTLVKCLCGQLDNYIGNIYLGNAELRDIGLQNLRSRVTYIGQDEKLFSASIKDNICLDKVDTKNFQKVIKICNLEEVLKKRIDKEYSIILEGASNISGGEKARIILARALFQRPQVLVVDETLSSVSERMENEILENLFAIENLTLIYITHRNKDYLFKKILFFGKGGFYDIK